MALAAQSLNLGQAQRHNRASQPTIECMVCIRYRGWACSLNIVQWPSKQQQKALWTLLSKTLNPILIVWSWTHFLKSQMSWCMYTDYRCLFDIFVLCKQATSLLCFCWTFSTICWSLWWPLRWPSKTLWSDHNFNTNLSTCVLKRNTPTPTLSKIIPT